MLLAAAASLLAASVPAQPVVDSLRAPAGALRIAGVARNDHVRLRTLGARCGSAP